MISATSHATRSDAYPLSVAQRRLWFLHQLEPDNPCYVTARAIRLVGALNLEGLARSLDAIVQRHAILRSTFPATDGQPVGNLRPTLVLSLEPVDLTALPPAEQAVRLQQMAIALCQTPLNLERDGLLRVQLATLAEQEHVLFWGMHQAVGDRVSCRLFLEELKAEYEAFCGGSSRPADGDAADFIQLQSRSPASESLGTLIDYWKTQLEGAPSLLPLPLDRPRSPVQTFNGATLAQPLPADLTHELMALCQTLAIAPKTLLLAAFKILLCRYTGQDDMIVGMPISQRDRPETAAIIGPLSNTLVLRTDLSGNPTVGELLQRVQATETAADAHRALPFEQLVEALHLERNLSYSPLFQVMFAYADWVEPIGQIADLQISELEFDSGLSPFDLTLAVAETADGLRYALTYNTDLFDPETMQRLSDHLQVLLAGMVATPDQPMLSLPLLTAAERQQILVDWNDRPLSYPDRCIHQLITEQCERTPEAIALRFEDQHLTYGDLNRRANQVAHALIQRGIQPGMRVGITMDRSLDIVVGILGILKSGATYVPIDPNYPKDRLTFMLEDTQLPVMLTQSHLLDALPPHTATTLCLDSAEEELAQAPSTNPSVTVPFDNLAYIMFTSGSTGRPKGVKVSHRSLRHYVLSVNHELQITASDTYLHTASFSFASSIRQSMIALTQGATVMIATPDQIRNPMTIYEIVQQRGVTVMDNVPSFWRYGLQAVENLSPEARTALITSKLRQVVFCGELLTWDIPQAIHRVFAQPPRLANFYAMTETTSVSLYHLPTELPQTVGPVPVGRAVVNVPTYILNADLQPMPIGVPGELHVGGAGISEGYFNRPELTDSKYIANPFSQQTGQQAGDRLHKTGDLARYRPDGTIEILGRIDDQVQLRGIRVELGEIEATLSQHPTVQTAVVIAREDVPGEKRVVAYLIATPDSHLVASELRSFLRERLPEYMVPSAFVFLDALPLNANRKVNRRALPPPDPAHDDAERVIVPARNLLETQLIKIWEEVLGVSPIGIRDNFFDLGGHSLLVMQMASQIEKILGKTLPLASLFQAPTIEQQANLLRQDSSGSWRSLVSIHPDGHKPPLFFIHAAGGHVIFYQRLVRHLPDRPIYGLQAQGLDGEQAPLTSVEAMAAHYITEIKTVQPQGPYYLGGLSFGGFVAFEMARQLQAQGDTVELVALLDTRGHGYLKRSPLPWLQYQIQRFSKQGTAYIWNRLKANLNRSKRDKVAAKLPDLTKQLGLDTANPNAKEIQRVVEANLRAADTYRPQLYSGKVAVFRAAREPVPAGWAADPSLGWGKFSHAGIAVYDIPSRHFEMFDEPYIQHLAAQLQRSLDPSAAST